MKKHDDVFEVNIGTINMKCFEKPRSDRNQELTREMILKALDEVIKHPEKYGMPFYTMIPDKFWEGYNTVAQLELYASSFGGKMADWCEQALVWAQQISNGESWEALCNIPDNKEYYRMVVGRDSCYLLIGDSTHINYGHQASYINANEWKSDDWVNYTVPLVVLNKA